MGNEWQTNLNDFLHENIQIWKALTRKIHEGRNVRKRNICII